MKYIEVIKRMPHIHCARGPKRCDKCKALDEQGDSYALIKVYLEPVDYASPITEVLVDGEKIYGAYDVVQRFENLVEAKKYAEENNLEIAQN